MNYRVLRYFHLIDKEFLSFCSLQNGHLGKLWSLKIATSLQIGNPNDIARFLQTFYNPKATTSQRKTK